MVLHFNHADQQESFQNQVVRPVGKQGKSGSTRTLVANRHAGAVIFLVGREKNEPGTDFSDVVVAAAKGIANGLQKQPISKLNELAADGVLKEICHGKKEQ